MRKYDIGFFSSCDRGLDVLLDALPKIEEKLGRKVTSVWAYGFDTFDQMHAKNPERMKFKWQIIRAMNLNGTENVGRLSHQEVAELMQDTSVWCYPTSFTEIFCITAIKAQAAKCKVVTSGVAALRETVLASEAELLDIANSPEKQQEFVDRVVAALKAPREEQELEQTKQSVLAAYAWPTVAKEWSDALS